MAESVQSPQLPNRPNDWNRTEGILSPRELEAAYEKFLEAAGMRLIAHLVEANNVLTIAGARPQTEFFIDNPTPDDYGALQSLAAAARPLGVYIHSVGEEFEATSDKTRTLMVNVFNYRALERLSHTVPFSGVQPYDASSGEEGARIWSAQLFAAVESAKKRGEIPQELDGGEFVTGLMKGYPIVAIEDCLKYPAGTGEPELVSTHLPSVELYGGAQPNFDYAPEHKDNPDIIKTVESWEKVLRDFYNTYWHLTTAANPAFQEERNKIP